MTAPDESSAALVLTLFGPLQVCIGGAPLPRLRSRNTLSLLALLTLRAGAPVEREWLARTLRPDADLPQALNSLRAALSELRSVLGSERKRLSSPSRATVALDLTAAAVDVRDFDAAIARGDISSLERAVTTLYRGPLLEGMAEDWVVPEREAREQDLLGALQTLAKAAFSAGEYDAASSYWRRAVSLDPLWDTARRGWMESLGRSGDSNVALQVYRDFLNCLHQRDPAANPEEETRTLYARLRNARPSAISDITPEEKGAAPAAVSGDLYAPATLLVGRDEERLEVAAALRRSRLVTLTGTGGIGKTRLAIAVGTLAAREYGHGVAMVALDTVSDPARVPQAIAHALGVQEEVGRPLRDTLIDFLRSRCLLLVLDNCEHVLQTSAQTAAFLLHECPGLRILATSREMLGIPGETLWAVPALMVPPDARSLPAETDALISLLLEYDSVHLFVARARAAQRAFHLTGENALAVAQICTELEGLPLAIELAAAQIRTMPVTQIAGRVHGHAVPTATTGNVTAANRHQTLRLTLDWSFGLLDEAERTLLQRLSIFAGGWSLEAAEQVCSIEYSVLSVEEGKQRVSSPLSTLNTQHFSVLDLLISLVDKSLVVFTEADGRYRLLEMVRQYAREKLESSGEAECVRNQHWKWCLALAQTTEKQITGTEQAQALQVLEAEHDNLRAAITGMAEAGSTAAETRLRLTNSLWRFWYMRGYFQEGGEYLREALRAEEVQERTTLRAGALGGAGSLALRIGDYAAAQALQEERLSICRELGPSQETQVASTLNALGNLACARGEHDRARTLYQEGLDLFRAAQNQRSTAWSLNNLGNLEHGQGNLASARALYEEGLAIRRQVADQHGIAFSLYGLGGLVTELGDWVQGQTYLQESLDLFQDLGEQHGVALALHGLGNNAHWQGDLATSRSLYTQSLDIACSLLDKELVLHNLQALGTLLLDRAKSEEYVRLWSAVCALRKDLGIALSPKDQREYTEQLEQARRTLGEAAFEIAGQEGSAFRWEQAVSYALSV